MNNSMDKIEHIVYLMLENRSLDNVLGWLYEHDNPNIVFPPNSSGTYNGLQTGKYFNKDNNGNVFPVEKGTGNCYFVPDIDPNEEYASVNNQLFETGPTFPNNPPNNKVPTMGGFYKDFSTTSSKYFHQIMQTYPPEMLPVINGLAKQYGVSDEYFASIPTQTNCNRAFAATGNSIGLDSAKINKAWVNNHFFLKDLTVTFNQRTIWNVLSDFGLDTPNDWMIYYSGIWEKYCFTQDLLDQINVPKFSNNFADINTFMAQAKGGTLPKFSFLEPAWGLLKSPGFGLQNGNDYHPPCNLKAGEYFLNQIYQALTTNPDAWAKTLFIINFDEHGGTYDHQPPTWNADAPWQNPNDGTQLPTEFELDFKFDRFGVRVPLILASPYVPQGLVFRANDGQHLDHSSVIATILNKFGVPKNKWNLGTRVLNAPTFEGAISLQQPRTAIPTFTPPLFSNIPVDSPPTDLQVGIADRVIKYAAKIKGYSNKPEALQALYDTHFNDEKIGRVSSLSNALKTVLEAL